MIGIYRILNVTNGKCYVGSSVNINQRWTKHKSLLRHNKHDNSKLQNAWNKYGENNFAFEVMEECPEDELLTREQYYIDNINNFDEDCYNISKIANTCIMSDEIRSKIKKGLKEKREQGLIERTNTKKCYQYNRFTGELIKVWDAVNDANRYYNTPNNTTSVIQRNLWGDTTTAFDSLWSFEEVNFIWARAPQKRSTIVVQNVIEKTYTFFDSIPIFLEAVGLNKNSRVTINACIKEKRLFKNTYFVFKLRAPVIFDRKPFELLGTREDIITKTKEEILGVNV